MLAALPHAPHHPRMSEGILRPRRVRVPLLPARLMDCWPLPEPQPGS